MIRRIAIVLGMVAIVWLGGRTIVHALASDETKIRWAIERACEGFDETRTNAILDALAPDFRDDTLNVSRDDVRTALAALFLQEKDPTTRGFPYRVDVPSDEITVQVTAGSPDSADVSLHARILDTRNHNERIAWELRLAGRMEEREQGWCFVRTTHRTLRGNAGLR